jgi:hypothetical protein
MSEWYFVLAPLALLAVLSLVRFVGCSSFGSTPDATPAVETKPGPTGKPVADYEGTVKKDVPVSYWRLQEKHAAEPSPGPTVPNAPVSGGTATDTMSHNNGTYKALKVQPPAPPPPPATPPYPLDTPSTLGTLALEAPGLLELTGQQSTSMSVDGGYVEVPFGLSLKLPSFSVEALVRPGWDPTETGLYRSVITFCTVDITPGAPKAFGFGLFAGPDPSNPSGSDVWQIWLADGTTFKLMKDSVRSLTPVDFNHTNYVGVTYDDVTKKLNMYVYVPGVGMDLDSGVAHPLPDVTVAAYSPVSNATQSLLIGMHRPPIAPGAPSPFPLYHPFKGRIQEVAIYGTALPVDRMASHVLAGLNL